MELGGNGRGRRASYAQLVEGGVEGVVLVLNGQNHFDGTCRRTTAAPAKRVQKRKYARLERDVNQEEEAEMRRLEHG